MKKTYVIDTNILIQAPYAIYCFEDNNLVIPLVVIEELDGLKKAEGEKGANARKAVRMIEELRMQGDLLTDISLKNGGTFRIEKNYMQIELPADLPDEKSDNRILKVCKGLTEEKTPDEQVILVTKDLILRIKADMLDIQAEDFTTEQITDQDAQYTGRTEVYIPEELCKEFKKKGVDIADAYQSDENGKRLQVSLIENEFVILKSLDLVSSNYIILTISETSRRFVTLLQPCCYYKIIGIVPQAKHDYISNKFSIQYYIELSLYTAFNLHPKYNPGAFLQVQSAGTMVLMHSQL